MESKLSIENRKVLQLSGVIKVNSATETSIDLLLENDSIIILGNDLHITKLDLGSSIIQIDGNINSLKFGKATKDSLLKKVFK